MKGCAKSWRPLARSRWIGGWRRCRRAEHLAAWRETDIRTTVATAGGPAHERGGHGRARSCALGCGIRDAGSRIRRGAAQIATWEAAFRMLAGTRALDARGR